MAWSSRLLALAAFIRTRRSPQCSGGWDSILCLMVCVPPSETGRLSRRTLRTPLWRRLLAHTVGNATEAAYFRSDLFELRRGLMEKWSEFLEGSFQLMHAAKGEELLPIGRSLNHSHAPRMTVDFETNWLRKEIHLNLYMSPRDEDMDDEQTWGCRLTIALLNTSAFLAPVPSARAMSLAGAKAIRDYVAAS